MRIRYSTESRADDQQERSCGGSVSAIVPVSRRQHMPSSARCRPRRPGLAGWLTFLTLATSLLFVSAAALPSASHPAVQYVEGEAIVTFKPSADFTAAQRVLKGHSLEFSRHFGFLSKQRG